MPRATGNEVANPPSSNQEASSEDTQTENNTRDLEIAQTRTVSHVSSYTGPIPPAEEFARYEAAYPGSADRILAMAEREQRDKVSFRNRSLLSATVIALATIGAIAVILTTNPGSLILVALALAYVLPSVTDFVRGTNNALLSKKERELELQNTQRQPRAGHGGGTAAAATGIWIGRHCFSKSKPT